DFLSPTIGPQYPAALLLNPKIMTQKVLAVLLCGGKKSRLPHDDKRARAYPLGEFRELAFDCRHVLQLAWSRSTLPINFGVSFFIDKKLSSTLRHLVVGEAENLHFVRELLLGLVATNGSDTRV